MNQTQRSGIFKIKGLNRYPLIKRSPENYQVNHKFKSDKDENTFFAR
ncbi:hypothetical protein [Trichodesmium erythraeum]|nr:hypothetical protein [Trichodesmium erythraeum GBRTRLIN201]